MTIRIGRKAWEQLKADCPPGASVSSQIGEQVVVDLSLPDEAIKRTTIRQTAVSE